MSQDEADRGKEEEPRVHVDQDWKKKVAEERERIREQEQEEQSQKQEQKRAEPLPEANLQVFLAGLYTQTLMALGLVESPVSGKKEAHLEEAQYLIDTIKMLEEKTKGNLTEEESRYLDNLLYDLRMRYIEASKAAPEQENAEDTT